MHFFDCTLCNLIAGVTVSILRKKCFPFPSFPFINTPSQMKIFIYSTYPFVLQPIPCWPTDFLINYIFSWKSKLKYTDIDFTSFFFQDTKSLLIKHKSIYWKRLMEPVKHLIWRFLQKLTVYSGKQLHLRRLGGS